MTLFRALIVLACVAVWLISAGYTAYLNFWVHPEYTRPQMFWAYWPIYLVVFGALVAAVLIYEWPYRRGK